MAGYLPIPHPADHSAGQLQASVQIHPGPGEEVGQARRTEEFNTEFYKTVERGVFKEVTKEEMAAWDSPVNYIAMVEAFKEGPHSTTPPDAVEDMHEQQPEATLPGAVSLSLNDCLIKGPSALVDLFTVTLCIREHRSRSRRTSPSFTKGWTPTPSHRICAESCGEGEIRQPR